MIGWWYNGTMFVFRKYFIADQLYDRDAPFSIRGGLFSVGMLHRRGSDTPPLSRQGIQYEISRLDIAY